MSNEKANIEVTLLSKEEIEGKSKVLQKVGTWYNQPYWTSTPSRFNNWCCAVEFGVTSTGELCLDSVYNSYGVRPVLKSDNLEKLIKDCKMEIKDGIQIVEYGEYPHLFEETETDNSSFLKKTGKTYSLTSQTYASAFYWEIYSEYDYKNQKAIKVGEKYFPVKPVRFYVDRENSMLISTDVLFVSPINVNNENYNRDFRTSQLYKFLNNEFIKELKPNAEIEDVIAFPQSKKKRLLDRIKELVQENETLKTRSNNLDSEIEEIMSQSSDKKQVKRLHL